ncbi:MAG: transcriptional repressor [Clostridia bacterium]|nr:transcriptional repressor [Clostridia bacterium]
MKYNTGKREQILSFLSENSHRSFELCEIALAITHDGHGTSTVYRIVSELLSEGKVRRLSDGKTRHCTYQYIGSEECHSHLHLKCRDCGKLIHLDEEISHEFCDSVLSIGGFTLESGCMLFGKCESCTVKNESLSNPISKNLV